jgi:hypothetical protein
MERQYSGEEATEQPQIADQSEVQFTDINTTDGQDEILRRAVEEEKRKLRITPGQLSFLRKINRKEGS